MFSFKMLILFIFKYFKEKIKTNRDCLHLAMLNASQIESEKQQLKLLIEELEFNSKL